MSKYPQPAAELNYTGSDFPADKGRMAKYPRFTPEGHLIKCRTIAPPGDWKPAPPPPPWYRRLAAAIGSKLSFLHSVESKKVLERLGGGK